LDNSPNDFAVDGAGDAVLQLQIHFRNGILGEDGSVGDITCMSSDISMQTHRSEKGRLPRTNSSGLDHVPDGEALDGLVLGCAATAVRAANGLHMAAALLVASTVRIISMKTGTSNRTALLGRALLYHFGTPGDENESGSEISSRLTVTTQGEPESEGGAVDARSGIY
jgi:hypothetical protein